MDAFSESRLGNCAPYFTVFVIVSCGYVGLKVALFILLPVFRMLRRICCGSVDFKKYGTWAVVTGSTDGIGKSYALQLAEKGMDIVLISRSPQKLTSVAEEIRSQHQVRVKTVTADFKRTDIYEGINQQLQGLDIGVLVNNVAILHEESLQYYHLMSDFLQFSKDSVNVNIMSCVMMTGLVLPSMVERGRGLIINLGSVAGTFETPFVGIYPATKAFMKKYSADLHLEYAPHGITVQLVAPSLVRTNMTDPFYEYIKACPGILSPKPDRYVRHALRTVGLEQVTSAYWPHELHNAVYSWIPVWLKLRAVLLPTVRARYQNEKKSH